MTGITNLTTLLANLRPELLDGQFVFITRPQWTYGAGAELHPIATFSEPEGLTLVVPKELADASGQSYTSVWSMITLSVNSSLNAVGLTAAVADALTQHGISANVIAAYHHDHVFVSIARASEAMTAIEQLANTSD